MPLEEISEGLIRFILRLVSQFFIEFVFEIICYFLGVVFLKVITFGKYPKIEQEHSENFVSFVGVLVLIVIFVIAVFSIQSFM